MAIEQMVVSASLHLTELLQLEALGVADHVRAIRVNLTGEDKVLTVRREEHTVGFCGEFGDLYRVRAIGIHDPDLRAIGTIRQERDPLRILGKTLEGKYRIESLAGLGGFSAVYRAQHVVWNEPVAIRQGDAMERALREELWSPNVHRVKAEVEHRTVPEVQGVGDLAEPMQDAADWLANYKHFWEQRFDQLAAHLEGTKDDVEDTKR